MNAPIQPPSLPPASDRALLLDLDGTLLDFAPEPMAVVVPPALPNILARLRDRMGGALAIVTGRPIAQIDALLPGIPTAVAGEHGGAIRYLPDAPIERASLPSPDPAWLAAAAALAAAHPGVVLETKSHGFVLHFRQAPGAGPALRAWLDTLPAQQTGFRLLPASMAWELKAAGADKGAALRALMARPPFAGRLPVFAGDDVTDLDAIAAARALGGVGLLVSEAFGAPEAVRRWLAALADAA